MPEHIHLILTRLVDRQRQQVCTLPEILDAIKVASPHMISKSRASRGSLWQDESFDHVLRSSESLEAKIQYLVENPVRRGLVRNCSVCAWLWRWRLAS